MRVDVLTLFPEMFVPVTAASILKNAIAKGVLQVCLTDVRNFAFSKHRVVDDTPFGGGAGMVMKVEPIVLAVEDVLQQGGDIEPRRRRVIMMSPAGSTFNQAKAVELSTYSQLVLICGHYEGIDERVVDLVVDEEISIGDFVLTGGELPAMVVIDCVARLLPGVLGSALSVAEETFSQEGYLEYPHYTRPREFRGLSVPDVLLSGDHARIAKWRRGQAIKRTMHRRPELFTRGLTKYDQECLGTVTTDNITTDTITTDNITTDTITTDTITTDNITTDDITTDDGKEDY